MAQLFPGLEQILEFKVAPEEGELHLLRFLERTLSDEYEVYFQPFLNGDRPDIVLMRRGSGVLLIEVKDWVLSSYSVDSDGAWFVHSGGRHKKLSPVKQVQAYRDNLFALHIESLLERKLKDNDVFAIVACAVYFHRAGISRVRELCGETKYIELLTPEALNKADFEKLLSRTWLSRPSRYFDDDLYRRFHRFLQPPSHTLSQGDEPAYSNKQKALSESKPGHQKIRGVAGSGKTKVLARRAVNAHVRTGRRILVLTFNITLLNYIHDSISGVRSDFLWSSFLIINYHQFFKSEAINHNLRIESLGDFDDERFFEPVKEKIVKFDAIFIDEIQDYRSEWIRLIKSYFLAAAGEFVVFGDEKQNVYGMELGADKRPNTTIPGAWNELNDSFRSSGRLITLAFEYQDRFFGGRYDLDEIDIPEQKWLFAEEQCVRYLQLGADAAAEEVFARVREVVEGWHVHPNDLCILSAEIAPLRDLEFLFRSLAHERTATMFESKEQWEDLCACEEANRLEMVLDQIRTNKKRHFWMNPGTVKFSTIHSFKGWEIDALVLLIDEGGGAEDARDDELIYTAMTRCRNRLLVINKGNKRYHEFFQEHIGSS